jgi:hypothetical protein
MPKVSNKQVQRRIAELDAQYTVAQPKRLGGVTALRGLLALVILATFAVAAFVSASASVGAPYPKIARCNTGTTSVPGLFFRPDEVMEVCHARHEPLGIETLTVSLVMAGVVAILILVGSVFFTPNQKGVDVTTNQTSSELQ